MRFNRRYLVPICSGLMLTGPGCEDGVGPAPERGSVKVSVVTTAEVIDRDKDGFLIRIGADAPRHLALDAIAEYRDIPAGIHSVRLEGVAPNCSISGPAEQSVEVIAGDTVSVSFAVSCVANVGTVVVTTVTTGTHPDADGYVLGISGLGTFPMETNGTRTISGVRAGQVSVFLGGLAFNCRLEPPISGTVTVVFGTTELRYSIRCEASGTLQITATSSGFDFDQDGFEVSILDQASGANRSPTVPANGTYSLSPLVAGSYLLTPKLRSNCSAAAPSILAVVVADAKTVVPIDVSCVAVGRMAFVKGATISAEIYVVTANGAGMKRITNQFGFDGDPAWSPDGRRIAFTSERDGAYEIYVMDADGGNPTRLTNNTALDYRPAWSPDGARIAFVSERDGNADIYVMDSDGGNAVNLTKSGSLDSDPAWSPDGNSIAFRTSRDGAGIWIMNADGSQPRALTSLSSDRHPAWSPDGKRIAFARDVSADTRDIFIIEANGGLLTPLTAGLMGAGEPAWSPDGSKIVITAITRDCFGFYGYAYPCYEYLAIYSTTKGYQETVWSVVPASDAAWAR